MILVILGPSGSGKTSLKTEMVKLGFVPIIGCTTREKRVGEIDGCHYHFISEAEYFKLELILKRKAGNRFYGMKKTEFCKKGDLKVIISSVDGILELEESRLDLKIIFLNINETELMARMIKRGDELTDMNERISMDRNAFDISSLKSPIIEIKEGSLDEIKEKCLNFIYNY